jgi:hypothetical protein
MWGGRRLRRTALKRETLKLIGRSHFTEVNKLLGGDGGDEVVTPPPVL